MASNEEISDGTFKKMLSVVSDFYDKQECIYMLKVLYSDYIADKYKLCKACKTMDLLQLLVSYADLCPTDFTILYETIKITGHFKLGNDIKVHIPSCPDVKTIKISKFEVHRQKLMKLGKVLTPGDVENISGRYNSSGKKYENNWSLIMDLERRMIICDGETEMEAFTEDMKSLKIPQAVKCLTEDISKTSSSSGSGCGETIGMRFACKCKSPDAESEDEPCQKDPLMSVENIVDTQGELPAESICQYVVEFGPVPNQFKKMSVSFKVISHKSLVFHLYVCDPNALESLYNISLSGELIQDLAEILVPADIQEEFIDRWSTDIDKEEYEVALSNLKAKGQCDLYHFCIISDDPEWETTLMEELKQKRPDLNYTFMKRWRLDKPETINHIIGQSKNVIVGFSPKPLPDYSKYAAHSVVLEMLEAKTLDDDKIIPFKITDNGVVPPEFESFMCHVWEELFVDKLLQNFDKWDPEIEISERNTDPTEMVVKDSKEVQSDLYDFCFISDNSKWENKLRKELQERMTDIKCTSKQDLSKISKVNLINHIDKSKKVILGFSTQPATVHPKSAANVVKEMLEENTLHHTKLIPVKMSEDAFVPPAFQLFTVANGWEEHFVDKLLKHFASKSTPVYNYNYFDPSSGRMLKEHRSWSLPNISSYGTATSIYNDYPYNQNLDIIRREDMSDSIMSLQTITDSDYASYISTRPLIEFDAKAPEETINFLALQTLTIGRGTNELRKYFIEKTKLTKPEIKPFLANERQYGSLKNVDFGHQTGKVFSSVNIEEFDIDIMMKLIRFCCKNIQGEDFWENPPDADNSKLANLVRIYQYKKTVLDRSYSIRVTHDDFENQWKDLTAMFTGVGVTVEEINHYRRPWEYKEQDVELHPKLSDTSTMEEIRNFLTISSLVIDVGTAMMREYFLEVTKLSKKDVGRYLMKESRKGSLKDVWKNISKEQKSKMFTPTADIDTFDMSIMYLIIRNCCSSIPDSFWKNPDRLTNLVHIYHYRNTYLAHAPNNTMSNEDFEIEWEKVTSMLHAAGATSSDINRDEVIKQFSMLWSYFAQLQIKF